MLYASVSRADGVLVGFATRFLPKPKNRVIYLLHHTNYNVMVKTTFLL